MKCSYHPILSHQEEHSMYAFLALKRFLELINAKLSLRPFFGNGAIFAELWFSHHQMDI